MIKIDLITGFLGSGKTTFLLKYARYLMKQGLKIGILEYDYGAINVDMLLLNSLRGPKCEIEMLAASCDQDCLKRRFKTKLIAMAMSGYDRVIIEPSGVFDMDMFFDDLRDDPLEKWYEIGSVITIVNANLHDEMSAEEDFVLASQVACAGCVLLSRTQLSDADRVENTKKHIEKAANAISCKGFNPLYIDKSWDELTDDDYKYIMNSDYHVGTYMKLTAGGEGDFSSVSFLNIMDDKDSFVEKVKTLLKEDRYGNIIRVKGFTTDGHDNYEINASQYEIDVRPTSIGQNVAIVIGTDLDEVSIKALFV